MQRFSSANLAGLCQIINLGQIKSKCGQKKQPGSDIGHSDANFGIVTHVAVYKMCLKALEKAVLLYFSSLVSQLAKCFFQLVFLLVHITF